MPKQSNAYFAAKMRAWRANNPEKVVAQNRARRLADPIRWQLKDAKTRARVRGIEFNIRHEDIARPTHCPVLGVELLYSFGREVSHVWNRATLDRWDNSKGYVPGNVFVISWRANKLKADATLDEVLHLARYMMHGAVVDE